MSKKEAEKKVAHDHTGSVAPEDENLTKWVIDLWSRKEHPERIEVWQAFGKEKRDKGEMIFQRDFPPDEKLDPEKCNHLANNMIAEAQDDTEATPKRRESSYLIYVIDRNRRANPLVKRLGPFQPKRSLSLARSGDGTAIGDLDPDEEDTSLRALEHGRLKTGFEEIRWGSGRNDRVLGELLLLYRDEIEQQRNYNKMLLGELREERKARNEADDLRVQREMMLEEKRFTIGLKKEAVRMGRNLLPGLFAEAKGEPAQLSENGNRHRDNGHSNGTTEPAVERAVPQYGTSTERTLIDNFLSDCESEEGLLDKLFGEADEQDGVLVVTKPGIFSPKQMRILIGVRGGFLPPSALDALLGGELAITPEQIMKAMQAGVTEGMGSALVELKEIREKAKAAASAKKSPPEPTATT